MIAISEMMKAAVWLHYDDAFRVCMMIRSNTKLEVIVMPHYDSLEHDGYCIRLLQRDPVRGMGIMGTVKMGLIAALCARHDLPADDVKAKKFYGPRFNDYPYFAEGMPKANVRAEIAGPVTSGGPR
jgi:hypothetical protein